MWLVVCLVGALADDNLWLNWSPNITADSQILAPYFTSTTKFSPMNPSPDCPESDKCQLSSTTPNPAQQVCDCGSQGVRWARMQLTDDLVEKITGAPPVNTDRCEYVSLGWTWNQSPENTQDIVMTMNPGGIQAVQLAKAQTQFLGNNARVRGEPCGIVYPDVFQGTPMYNENESVNIFPGSVPVSDYCLYSYEPSGHAEPTTVEPSFQDGIAWQEDWSSIMIEGLGAVDAVCRCALGRVGAMLEMSGVFFTNPAFTSNITAGTGISSSSVLQARADDIFEAYQWRETPQYVTPLIFYCREDYVLYWNLMLAYEAIYNVTSPLHPIWLDAHARATGEQDALYWQRFYSLGVDCLINIPIDSVQNPCLMMDGGSAPFLINVGVILDIGQLFRSFDLVTWCNVSAEIHVPRECVRDYIWALASSKRRGQTWTSLSDIFENKDILFNISYNYSLPTTASTAIFPANINPVSNIYEYAMESAALFVRIIAYSDVEDWSVNVFDIDDDMPTIRGTECTEDMVSGEVRNGPPRTFTNITQRGPAIPKCGSKCDNQGVTIDNCATSPELCVNTAYANNYSYCTWNEADGPTTVRQYQSCGYLDYTNNPISNGQNCPNAYPIRTKTYNATTITGYCVTGRAPQAAYECDNCGTCKHKDASTTGTWLNCNKQSSIDTCSMNISNPGSEIGTSHFHYYGQSYVCGNSFSYTYGSQKNTASGYCFSGPDALSLRTQNLYYYFWTSSPDCGKIVESCGSPVSISVNSNWVGERYIPVYGNPRMRGMMPRPFYNMSDGDCDCTTSSSICFNSGLSNYCTMYMPRPAAASIFARGSSPTHLDYRAVFFDPMLEDLFAEASASPPPPFVSKAATGQFNGASAVYGNTSYFGYGGPLYASSFCKTNAIADFCIGLQGEYSLRFLTNTEYGSYQSATTHGFAGVLANYYSALVGRSAANVGPWFDTYFQNISELPVVVFKPAIVGTSVDLCFLYGWCAKSNVYAPVSGKTFLPLYNFAQLQKPTFDGTNEPRAAYYSKPGYTEAYPTTAGAWKGDPSIPFYKWNNYQAGVPFGWGEYKPLLQQVLTWGDSTYSFSNQFTNERRMYGSAITTRPKAAWCWKSSRGFVNDLQASNLGSCITEESCYQSFTLTTQITSELGCIANFNATGWTQVNVIGNMVQWGVPVTDTHTTQCYEMVGSRICIMPPGQNPPSFRNENFLVQATNVSADTSTNTLLSVTALTCGCDPSNFDTIDSPTWMCRVNSITSTNGNCYIRTNSTCDAGDFNCGTQFTAPEFYNLCQYCPTIGVPTVGQCKGSICLGLLNNGSCPAGSALCTVTRNSFAAGQGSLYDASTQGDAFLWYNGTTHNFFEDMPSMMSTITADRPVPDPVHCLGLQAPNNNYATVEKPKYLRGNTVLNDGPGSLVEEALDVWCGAGDCTGNRQWLCVDKGQSIFTSTQQCRLRKSWVSTFYIYKNALGKTVSYYGDTSTAQLMPDCAAWVPGIDDDSMCQNDAFTGCVITRVGQHIASMGTPSGDIFRGSVPTDAWVPFASSTQDTYSMCQQTCVQTAKCIAWYYNASCTLYNETDWSLDTGNVDTTVGSAFPITAGFFVPRTNAGPVYEILAGDVLTTYPVTGIDLFTTSNGITIKYSEYNATECVGTFYYYGGSPVMLRSTPVTGCTIVSNISAYTTPLHTFPAKPLIVRVSITEVYVVGLLTEGDGFNADIYTDGVTGDTINGKGRGLRGALRVNDAPFTVTLRNNMTSVSVQTTPAGWIFGEGQPSVVSASVMRTLRRLCVPITIRQTVDTSTLAQQAQQYNIIRTEPVDCIVAGSNSNNYYVNNYLFGNNGICAGAQDLQWPGLNNNNVAKISTLNSFSWWSWVLAESKYPAPLFYDPMAPESNSVNGIAVPGAPNCGQNAETCLLAYDIIGYTPCTDVTTSIWFTCMKPTMMALFPLYDPDFSYELSTPFLYPDDLYVNVRNVNSLNADDKWSEQQWSQYITMVHYCDRYSYDTSNPDEQNGEGTNGWKPGKFVACDNDPFTNDQRVEFCRIKQPWWVITGLVFTQFSINDLCPFLSGSANKYCFVFADHPMYSTVGALLSASIGQEWDDTTFYYVPFTLEAMGYILFNPHVVNTLISNNMFTQGEPILTDNYGPAAAQFINNGANLCEGQLTIDGIMSIYNVLQTHYDPGTDTYTFGLTAESTDSTVTIPADPPIFSETSALIQYNGLTLVGLGPPARIGSSATTVVNQIRVCTRFQIDGSDIKISNFIFDQSKCYLTGAAQQTPIVFSGAFGSNVVIYDITVIDSAVAVAVLGGDSLVYTYVPIIDVDGLLIYNVSFQYTTTSQPGEKYTLAVLGRSTGVPTIAYCSFYPPGYSVLPNCVLVADVPETGHPDCAMPNECIYDKNGCCGRNSQVRRTFGCEYGLTCIGNRTDIDNWYKYQPNARIMCNQQATGCNTGVQDCISLQGENCYYNRTGCSVLASEDIIYLSTPLSTSGNGSTSSILKPVQSWQYYTPGDWYFVPPYPSARNPPTINYVDGIGFGNLVWTIQGNESRFPTDFQVHALPVGTAPSGLNAITVIPQFQLNLDGIAQDTTKLVLMTEWYISQRNLNTTFVDIITKEWCVGVNGSRLVVLSCDEENTDWYFDKHSGSVHLSNYPHMCATSLNGPLYWLPCLACHVGLENTLLSNLQQNKTQLFYNNTAVTSQGYIAMQPVNYSVSIVQVIQSIYMGYILDDDLNCLTFDTSTNETAWLPCHPNFMFPYNRNVCASVGILRYICTQGYGGSILEAALVDSTCVFETALAIGNGFGATLSLANGIVQVVHSGDGYMNGEIVQAGPCDVVVYTPKVLVQPVNINFSLASAGVEVVNVAELTDVLDAVYEADAVIANMTLDSTLDVLTIFLAILTFVLLIILIAACWYKQHLIVKEKNE